MISLLIFHLYSRCKHVKKVHSTIPYWCPDLEKEEWGKLVEKLLTENVLRSTSVIRAMRSVPRVSFLPENMQSYGAADTPLPIGFGQTVSAPHGLGFHARLGETWFQL